MQLNEHDTIDVELENGAGADQDQHQDGTDREVEGADLNIDRADKKAPRAPSRGDRRYHMMTARLRQLERRVAAQDGELKTYRERAKTSDVERTLGEAETEVSQRWHSANDRYRQALAKHGKAASSGDDAAIEAAAAEAAAAQAEMVEQAAKATRLREHRATLQGAAPEARDGDPRGRAPQQDGGQELLRNWLDENSDWFVPEGVQGRSQDQAEMTARAIRIEDALAKRGIQKNTPQMFEAINTEMQRAFPAYFGGGAPPIAGGRAGASDLEVDLTPPKRHPTGGAPPLVGATPGGSAAGNGKRNAVKLTAEEVRYARDVLNMPIELYARGKQMAEQNA
jgi:hypothetical protein